GGQQPVDDDLQLTAGGGGPTTDLLCGAFALEGNSRQPLLSALPEVLLVRGDGERPLPWLATTLQLIALQIHTSGVGAAAVLERVSEVMLGQALRATVLDLHDAEHVNVEALYDRGIAPSVRAIPARPEHAWPVGELASLSVMSRSAFAARFRALTGDSPIRYVARCRLARAARELRMSDAALGEVAGRAGYESVFSFSRAFKRAFGVPPRTYRAREGVTGTPASDSASSVSPDRRDPDYGRSQG